MKDDKPGCSISADGLMALTIVLVILKALGFLACSWWWVFAPIWIPAAIAIVLIFLAVVLGTGGRNW